MAVKAYAQVAAQDSAWNQVWCRHTKQDFEWITSCPYRPHLLQNSRLTRDLACCAVLYCAVQVHVFKKKARKRYSKLQGHRSHITALRILEVRQPAAEQAAAAVSNVAAIGAGANQALDISSTKLTPHQLKAKRRSSRPAVSAAVQQLGRQDTEAAAEPDMQQQLRQPRRLAGAGRAHGPPAVLNAMGFVEMSGSSKQQASR